MAEGARISSSRMGEEVWLPTLTVEKIRRLVEEAAHNPPPEALAAVHEGRVYLLDERLDLWLIKGNHGDYVVIRGVYCSCPWFTTHVLTGKTSRVCYHLVAVELAARGAGRYLRIDQKLVRDVVMEALLDGFTRTLRALELRATGGSLRDQRA